ncbi:relaxin-like [Eucyclogobius newberryi]|uniref:relaxin-like n=1 Tax=Eucyclogobius newberryi TaxID=166745 RepID=UPI003B5A5FFF
MRSAFVGVLLCLLCVAQIESQNNANTLRLCGRAFLRALVFTCGGSRWKRLMTEDGALLRGITAGNPLSTEVLKTMNRQRRDQHQALVTECCDVGCQKSDLSLLC